MQRLRSAEVIAKCGMRSESAGFFFGLIAPFGVFARIRMQVICEFLTVNDPPANADLILVLAGRPERKSYGLRLFQEGFAGRLILSVGRFEVRQVATLE